MINYKNINKMTYQEYQTFTKKLTKLEKKYNTEIFYQIDGAEYKLYNNKIQSIAYYIDGSTDYKIFIQLLEVFEKQLKLCT
jgi:ribosomal protein L20A (L18A)